MNRLGEPGIYLADTLEQPVVKLEDAPGSGAFRPWVGPSAFTVTFGANDKVPSAVITVGLADDRAMYPDAFMRLRDWQVRDPATGEPENPLDLLGAGRRVRIQTNRGALADEWLIFEGFVDRFELGWGAPPRSLKLFCISTAIAADRDPSQWLSGQWWRSRDSELALLLGEPPGDGQALEKLVHVGAQPLIFNPKGVPNCHPVPVTCEDETKVYVFCDPESEARAIPWTYAKALRYIQFAALQSAQPEPQTGARYDIGWSANLGGVKDTPWLRKYRLDFGNFNALIDPLLSEDAYQGGGAIGKAALLVAPANLSCETVSVLEAFAHVCERGALMLTYRHLFKTPPSDDDAPPDGGGSYQQSEKVGYTSLLLKVRGWRSVAGQPGSVTGRYLSVPSDYVYNPNPSMKHPYDTMSQVEKVRRTGCVGGSILFDHSGRRNRVFDVGDAVQYEVTVELRPGWKPDPWWDNIDPNDPAAVAAALARIGTAEWNARYSGTPSAGGYGIVGRLWVLNEDGAFRKGDYKRLSGPWNTDEVWEPFNFRAECNLKDLEARGGNGWSARRRRFLPSTALWVASGYAPNVDPKSYANVGVYVEVSYNAGATWRGKRCSATFLEDRCGLMVTNEALEALTPNATPDAGEAANFVAAYMVGKLRIRVTANVEGDDAAFGVAPSYTAPYPGLPLEWGHMRSRRGTVKHVRRDKANSILQGPLPWPLGRDDSKLADGSATRLRNELIRQRIAGSVVLPYLLRSDEEAADGLPQTAPPWERYEVGDELDGIDVGPEPPQDAANGILTTPTALTFRQGSGEGVTGPRIVELEYVYDSQAGGTTRLQIEDETYATQHPEGDKYV